MPGPDDGGSVAPGDGGSVADAGLPADTDVDMALGEPPLRPDLDPIAPGIIGWWRFDEGTTDSSPAGRACALVGDAHVENDAERGDVLVLDGDGDYVDCGPAADLTGRNTLTVAAWVKVAAFHVPYQSFVGLNGEDCGWKLRRGGDTPYGSFVMRGTSGTPDMNAPVNIDDRGWHHLAAVYDGHTRQLLVDGEVAGRATDSGNIAACGDGDHLILGAFGSVGMGGHHFDPHRGSLDDVRIYDVALTADQVRRIAHRGAQAWDPTPEDGARWVAPDETLAWKPGVGATHHDLYFGTDRGAVEAARDARVPPGRGPLAEGAFDPGPLTLGTTYFWRVDETGDEGLVPGPIWSFTVEDVAGGAPEGYALISAGTFMMGSTAEADPYRCGLDCWDVLEVEKHHQVTISRDFWMKRTEVTQGEWQALTGSNPSVFTACGANCPVENLTWWQMAAFTTLLSQRDDLEPCYRRSDNGAPYDLDAGNRRVHPDWPAGLLCEGYRLPTEAEWEYAARAGTQTPLYTGATSWEALDPISWNGRNSGCNYPGCEQENCRSGAGVGNPAGIHPVAQKQPNAWGLHDTLGNVWEFVWDVFGEYHGAPVTDPTGPARLSQGYHVARGGGWLNGLHECRVSARDGNDSTCDPDNGPGPHVGFRVARTAPR